jgi:hypothetical protein
MDPLTYYRRDEQDTRWFSLCGTFMSFGILVHINLNYVVGGSIIIVASTLALVVMIASWFWPGRAPPGLRAAKHLLILGELGLALWASVLTFQKAGD